MPIAITPRRRSRDEVESDEAESVSSNVASPLQSDSSTTKRVRLNNGSAYPSTNGILQTNGYHTQTNSLQKEALRSKRTRRKHQPGSIVRVKLANFVTYTAVEFFPGPSLNMVIGPNGTGKSTLVCAICLGLGWGPQHLGRAKEVSEFVKHGCQEATIEIELAKDRRKFKKNIVIRCTIKREGNKTVFSINDKPQSKKTVVELCKSLSIQIDNLCQFLPQDKVVEFAAMTPVELLKSTQRAVASQEMIDMHEQLKDFRKKQKDAQARCTADQETLTNLEGRQRLQEADVERMRERAQVEEHIWKLEAARPFAAYRDARLLHRDAKEKRKAAQGELTRLQDEVEPSLRALKAKERYKAQIQFVASERKGDIVKAEKTADNFDRKFRDLQDRHNELVSEYDAEINSGKNAKKEVARYDLAISNIQRQMQDQPPELDAQAYNERVREKRRDMESYKTKIHDLQEQQKEASNRGRELYSQVQKARVELENLDSQAGKQNIKLQNHSMDAAKMWEWVQAHQDEFEKHVFGPPIVECTVNSPQHVDKIESLLQRTNLLSFTVQTQNDFKKLSDIGANVLHLRETTSIRTMPDGLEHFKAPVGLDEMRRYGLDSWAIDHLSGPEPVLGMLCAEMHLHETGIALRDTSPQQYDLLHNSAISYWATNRSTYRIIRRREYGSSATSTQVKQVRPAVVWTEQPVDLTAKRELQESIQGWSDEMNAIKTANAEAQNKIQGHREAMTRISEEEKEIVAEKTAKQKALGEFKALPTKLAGLEEKTNNSQNAVNGVKDRLKAISEKQDEIAINRAEIALDHADAVEALRVCHDSLYEAEVMLIEASSECETLQEKNRSVNELLETRQRDVNELETETKRLQAEARSLLATCTRLLNGDDATPELKDFFKSLPDGQTKEELESEIESEKARLELMHEGNDGVIKEYELRQKKINAMTTKLDEIKEALAELDETITRLRDQWEPELDNLVNKISHSFSNNMEQISCAGEVGVYKDDDFDQWAIQIRVKFRENEPLTTLDSHRQSGGERAVSTIFYLMSLQSLTRSPFRVVDEINQGMDPRNERLVHKRMVGIACGEGTMGISSDQINRGSSGDGVDGFDLGAEQDDAASDGEGEDPSSTGGGGSQYFLITPKLLHNLTYERGMRVLCIASGEYMPPDRSRVDFKACLDKMKGLKGGVGLGVAAA
ncbi:Structural maintenance of chromosomes protein 5 [Lecanora helva]